MPKGLKSQLLRYQRLLSLPLYLRRIGLALGLSLVPVALLVTNRAPNSFRSAVVLILAFVVAGLAVFFIFGGRDHA
jgi:heme/copper-type cytochrome/quinol oxidase subunit 4